MTRHRGRPPERRRSDVGRQPLRRPARPAARGRPARDRARHVRRRRRRVRDAARRVRPQRRRLRHDHDARRRRGPRAARRRSPCSPVPSSTATCSRRGSTSRAATASGRSASWPTATSASPASPSRSSSPSRATSPRTPATSSSSRSTPSTPSSATTRRWPPAPAPCTRVGRTTRRAHPPRRPIPSSTPSSPAPPTSSPRRSTSTATCACRWSAAAWSRSGTGSRNELVVHTSTQGAHGVRGFLSRALGLPENRVRVVMQDVGGGFGQKMFMLPDEVAVVLAGKRLGRPVKWIEDRRENLMAGQHARDDRMTVSFALDADAPHPRRPGRAGRGRRRRSRLPGAAPSASSACCSPGPTRSPGSGSRRRPSTRTRAGAAPTAGPWMMETLVREQMMDTVARQLGLDPLELRRRNVIDDADLPYTTATGMSFDQVSIGRSLEQAVEMIGYDELRAEQAAARRRGPAARHRVRPVRRAVGPGDGQHVERGAPSSASASTVRCRR